VLLGVWGCGGGGGGGGGGNIFDGRRGRGVCLVSLLFGRELEWMCVCVCVYTHIHTHTARRVLLDVSRGVATTHLRPESPKNSR